MAVRRIAGSRRRLSPLDGGYLWGDTSHLSGPDNQESKDTENIFTLSAEDMVIPTSLMQQIESEIREDRCDFRVVLTACGAFKKGSHEFNIAYIRERVRAYNKRKKYAVMTDLVDSGQYQDGETIIEEVTKQKLMNTRQWPKSHPNVINNIWRLLDHFSYFVFLLIVLQFVAAWKCSILCSYFMEGDRPVFFSLIMVIELVADMTVWLTHRGKLKSAFFIPGLVLIAAAIIPIIATYALCAVIIIT